MKIAFLSDIHANIEAFKAVLEVIDREDIDSIYIAGDLVGYYYHPDKVIDICMSRDDIHCIRGNHDRNFLAGLNDESLMSSLISKYGSSYALTKEKLSNHQVSWLKKLPTQLRFEIEKITITIAHGSIHSEDEYVYPSESVDNLASQLSKSEFTVLGHTHHPFLWCNNNRWLINPGSVGQPRDQSAESSFIYLDLNSKTLLPRKVKFPIEKLVKEIENYDPNHIYLKTVLRR
jgi:putative phosphoesterase